MVDNCKQCGANQAKYPFKGQPDKTIHENYKEGTLIWKNLFMMTLNDIVLTLIILGMTLAYWHDTKECHYIIEHPKESCEKIGAIFPVPPPSDAFSNLPIFNTNYTGG